MASPRRPRPNPFYVLLVLASTIFVVSCLAYLISPEVGDVPAAWLDEYGPVVLGIEFAVMLAAGLLAMIADRLSSRPG